MGGWWALQILVVYEPNRGLSAHPHKSGWSSSSSKKKRKLFWGRAVKMFRDKCPSSHRPTGTSSRRRCTTIPWFFIRSSTFFCCYVFQLIRTAKEVTNDDERGLTDWRGKSVKVTFRISYISSSGRWYIYLYYARSNKAYQLNFHMVEYWFRFELQNNFF